MNFFKMGTKSPPRKIRRVKMGAKIRGITSGYVILPNRTYLEKVNTAFIKVSNILIQNIAPLSMFRKAGNIFVLVKPV